MLAFVIDEQPALAVRIVEHGVDGVDAINDLVRLQHVHLPARLPNNRVVGLAHGGTCFPGRAAGVGVDNSLLCRVPTHQLVHHFERVAVRKNNFCRYVTLLAGLLGNDGAHRIHVEVHAHQQRETGNQWNIRYV